jgi:Methylamine utilisation protein MauE
MIESLFLLVQLSLGLVFLAAFATKVRAPAELLRGIAEYEVLPPSLARAAGILLIPMEGFLALAHLTGWMLAPASIAGLATLSAFTVAVSVNLGRRRDLPCHCFGGGGKERISRKTLARLLLMLGGELAVLAGVGLAPERFEGWVFPARIQSASELIHTALLCVLLLTVSAWLLRARDVWSLFQDQSCYLCAPLSKEEKKKRRSSR